MNYQGYELYYEKTHNIRQLFPADEPHNAIETDELHVLLERWFGECPSQTLGDLKTPQFQSLDELKRYIDSMQRDGKPFDKYAGFDIHGHAGYVPEFESGKQRTETYWMAILSNDDGSDRCILEADTIDELREEIIYFWRNQ